MLATILPVCPMPLFGHRPLDFSSQGYKNWIFMSTHYWDEDPQGLWTLGLENKGYYFNTGTLFYYTLLLYGTAEDMTARPQGPQVTSRACVHRGHRGAAPGKSQFLHHPGLALPHLYLRVVVALQPHRAASDRGTGQLSSSYYTC